MKKYPAEHPVWDEADAALKKIWEENTMAEYHPPLDPGIAKYVEILREAGAETYESCEGGDGHSYFEPTIRFYGDHHEGFRVLAIALQNALPVKQLNRIWVIIDGEPTGPNWELVFWR